MIQKNLNPENGDARLLGIGISEISVELNKRKKGHMKKALNLLLLIGVFELTIQTAYIKLDPGTGNARAQKLICNFTCRRLCFKSIFGLNNSLFQGVKKI